MNSLSSRRRFAIALLFAAAACGLSGKVRAQTIFPGADWEQADPSRLGWSDQKLELARDYAAHISSTAVLVVHQGYVVMSHGDVARPVRIASMRKSILSALYGIAIAEKKIDPARTLLDLGIDDKPPTLTVEEKQATIRDLLMARSGVYHHAASEPPSMRVKRPARGSQAPGSHWYYNNWDFNALGSIYRQLTGQDIFRAVEQRIARPIGMQDFTAANGKYVFDKTSSHPAYHMDVSARDMARFGWLFANDGSWNGRQIIPGDWVRESTRVWSDTQGEAGYGYMWWPSKPDLQLKTRLGPGSYSARGFGGQYLFVIPGRKIVIVHLTDQEITRTKVGNLLEKIWAAAPSAR